MSYFMSRGLQCTDVWKTSLSTLWGIFSDSYFQFVDLLKLLDGSFIEPFCPSHHAQE